MLSLIATFSSLRTNKMTVLAFRDIHQTRLRYETTRFGLAYQRINRL